MVNYYDLAIGRWEGEGGALEACRHNATPTSTEYAQKLVVRELTSKGDLPWWLRFGTRPFKHYVDAPRFTPARSSKQRAVHLSRRHC
jgi:hypothetical protein